MVPHIVIGPDALFEPGYLEEEFGTDATRSTNVSSPR